MVKASSNKNQIIEPEFAKRFETASDNNDLVPPYNFGRLGWIADRLKKEHSIRVSNETVRKWFAGESRPRPDKMKALAEILRVSESWLSLGIRDAPSAEDVRKRGASAIGAVSLVAGMFAMNGANYAFPDSDDPQGKYVHFYAMAGGRQNSIFVAVGEPTKDGFRFNITNNFENLLTIGVVMRSPTHFDLYQISASTTSRFGNRRGDHSSVLAKDSDEGLSVQGEVLPKVEDFLTLRRTPIAA